MSASGQNGGAAPGCYPRSGTPGSLPPPASPASSCGGTSASMPTGIGPSSERVTPAPSNSNGNGPTTGAGPGANCDQRRGSVDSETGSYYSAGSVTPGPQVATPGSGPGGGGGGGGSGSGSGSAATTGNAQGGQSGTGGAQHSTTTDKKLGAKLPDIVPNESYSSQGSGGQGGSRPPSTSGSIGPPHSDVSSLSASPGSSVRTLPLCF